MAREFQVTSTGLQIENELQAKIERLFKRGFPGGNLRNFPQETQDEFGLLVMLSTIRSLKDLDDKTTFTAIAQGMGAYAEISLWKDSDIRRFIKLAIEAGWIVEIDDDEDLAPRPRRRTSRRLFTR